MAGHNHHPSSPAGMHLHHGPQGHPQVNGHIPMQAHPKITPAHLASLNEAVWLGIGEKLPFSICCIKQLIRYSGSASELMGDLDGALAAYEQALRHNYQSITAMNAISCILRTKENFPRAVEFLQSILKLDPNNGEVWGSLGEPSRSSTCSHPANHGIGHCYLMMEDLQQAYAAYQQALYHLRDPKVRLMAFTSLEIAPLTIHRNPSCGMASEYSTIAMAPSNMPRKPFLKSCTCNPISKRQTRYISG